jgi:hypothetical protein
MVLAQWFFLQVNSQELKIEQYPDLFLTPEVLARCIGENNIKYNLDIRAPDKNYLQILKKVNDFSNITIFKFENDISMDRKITDLLYVCGYGAHLIMDLSFSETLKLLHKIYSIEKLKAFW